jgi:hypothetical protein
MLFSIITNDNSAQIKDSSRTNILKVRTAFLSLGSGFPEYLFTRVGCQIDDDWSISGKLSIYYSKTGGAMNFGVGIIGLRLTKYFKNKILFFNNVSTDLGFLKTGADNCYAIDVSIGNESIYKSIRPFWAIGLSIVQEGKPERIYVTPGIKVGININF